ncbi:MAG: replication initiator protein A [Rhodobacteraceae bacterium]|nr:replication initiator protein A [Paracoccaceae bacterium]
MDDDLKPIRPMLPARHQPGLFSLNISSISLKDTQQQLEFPFFALSKKPDLSVRRYEDHLGNSLEITPSVKGLPTLYDKDFLICAISNVMDRLNRGEFASRRVRMYAADMLEFTNRSRSGRDYMALDDAITRLRGCTIKTNIRTGDIYRASTFGLIESGDLVRKYGWDGRLQYVEITLSEWLWNAIEARQVLTLHPHYFRLRQPLERRLYEIARKFCGRQAEWRISLVLLHERSGSKGNLRLFRQAVRRLATQGELLDYAVVFDSRRDMAIFQRQEGSLVDQIPSVSGQPPVTLPDSAAAEARRRHGEKIGLAAAERDWRRWMNRKGVRPTNPAALFLSFLDIWADRRRRNAAAADSADGNKSDWIQEMAGEWWKTLGNSERTAWRQEVGERVELEDGEGWFRSEKSMARAAFNARWRHQDCPTEEMELPPQLLARAVDRAGPDTDAQDFEEAWRKWIAKQPDWRKDTWLFSVLEFAGKHR